MDPILSCPREPRRLPRSHLSDGTRERGDPMPSYDTRRYITSCRLWRVSALVFLMGVFSLLCCDAIASEREASARSSHLLPGGQMTQDEAVRSALAELVKRNPDATFKSYTFEKLIHIPEPRPDLVGSNGYYLCGHIKFEIKGKIQGPLRIAVIFSETKILGLIVYDNPETGGRWASFLCSQVQEIDRNR
jgi:hypothetical protein